MCVSVTVLCASDEWRRRGTRIRDVALFKGYLVSALFLRPLSVARDRVEQIKKESARRELCAAFAVHRFTLVPAVPDSGT